MSSERLQTLEAAWRDAWKLPERLTPSKWAESYRVLTAAESAEPGRYSFDRTPYLKGLIDAAVEPGVEEIVFLKCTQVGGSESERNLLGYWIDNDPGPCMVVMPSESAAEELIRDRVRPLLQTPQLARHLSPNREDNTLAAIKLDTMPIFTGWAGSPQSLASKPCRYVLFDEVDKYPTHSGREADPISLATERTQTFGHRKRIVKISTPTTRLGAIWQAWEACGQKRQYHVPCPHCGHEQTLKFPQVKWPKPVSEKVRLADAVEQGRLAWYECEACKEEIRDHHKPKMLLAGRWVSEGEKSKRVGFHLNSLYSPWCTFSGIAAEFIRADGDVALTQNFRNSRMAEPFEEQVAKTQPSVIENRKINAPEPGVLPSWAVGLYATADVQQDKLYFVIRAWGYGFRSQLLRYGQVLNFDALYRECIETPIPCEGGGSVTGVELLAVDGKYRTNEVFEFAKRLPTRIAITQGMSNVHAQMVVSRAEQGVTVFKINPNRAKDRLHEMLSDGDPTRWRVHKDIGDDYCSHLASHHKVFERKLGMYVWRERYSGVEDHLLDCESNQCAVATSQHMDVPIPDDPPVIETAHPVAPQNNFVNGYRGRY